MSLCISITLFSCVASILCSDPNYLQLSFANSNSKYCLLISHQHNLWYLFRDCPEPSYKEERTGVKPNQKKKKKKIKQFFAVVVGLNLKWMIICRISARSPPIRKDKDKPVHYIFLFLIYITSVSLVH